MSDMNNTKAVTLRELWEIFVQRWWVIFLIAGLCAGGFMALTEASYVPRYESTATLYILRQNGEESNGSNSQYYDFTMALNVVNDCTALLKSHSVIDRVIGELNLTETYRQLSDSISTSNPDNTRILKVTVEADTAENAKRIVDAICEEGQNKITEAMGFQQVNLYEHGILNPEPCNKTGLSTYIIVGIVAALVTYLGMLIAYITDDRLWTEEDIKRYLSLSVLGDIPNADQTAKKRGYYKYKYKGYGKDKDNSKEG